METFKCYACRGEYPLSLGEQNICAVCRFLHENRHLKIQKRDRTPQKIRYLARLTTEFYTRKCLICGEKDSLETCHKKAISTFSSHAYLSEINAFSNLVLLCRNCHWKLDHGVLTLPEEIF